MNEILKLSPAFKDYIWGGNKLKALYNAGEMLDRVAEAWVLSCHKSGMSTVQNGTHAGLSLPDALEKMAGATGACADAFEFFPILIKLIDAADTLSVQVHPSDSYALEHEGEYGKTEMWLVLDAEPGAVLYYGFEKPTSREEVAAHIAAGTLTDILHKEYVKKGDCLFIAAGTVHAIGKGLLIAEIQQNSNLTYRVYDFGRTGADGKPRELHIEKALEVMDFGPAPRPAKAAETLSSCEYFTVLRKRCDGALAIAPRPGSFKALLCLEGRGKINDMDFSQGDCLFIPADMPTCEISGVCEFLEVFV